MVSRGKWIALLLLVALAQSNPLVAGEGDHALQARRAEQSLLLAGARRGSELVAVGERGHILLSADHGRSWRQAAEVPTRATLTAVTFHDDALGWAVGHGPIILRTTDGGEHWQLVFSAPELEMPLLNVWFADADHGFAVGAYGYLLVTRDGGESWEERVLDLGEERDPDGFPPDWHLNHVTRSATGRFYLAAEQGNIYRSDDEGHTWCTLSVPYPGSFYQVLLLEADSLLALGLRGHLLRSDDAGVTWHELSTGTQSTLLAGVRLADGPIVIAGLGGSILTSGDGGRSFQLRQAEDRSDVSALVHAADGSVVALGAGGARRLQLATAWGAFGAPVATH